MILLSSNERGEDEDRQAVTMEGNECVFERQEGEKIV
jgi:hypothetical protein